MDRKRLLELLFTSICGVIIHYGMGKYYGSSEPTISEATPVEAGPSKADMMREFLSRYWKHLLCLALMLLMEVMKELDSGRPFNISRVLMLEGFRESMRRAVRRGLLEPDASNDATESTAAAKPPMSAEEQRLEAEALADAEYANKRTEAKRRALAKMAAN